jgi:hypothetical protein
VALCGCGVGCSDTVVVYKLQCSSFTDPSVWLVRCVDPLENLKRTLFQSETSSLKFHFKCWVSKCHYPPPTRLSQKDKITGTCKPAYFGAHGEAFNGGTVTGRAEGLKESLPALLERMWRRLLCLSD